MSETDRYSKTLLRAGELKPQPLLTVRKSPNARESTGAEEEALLLGEGEANAPRQTQSPRMATHSR